jgi:hypothetical protein
MVRIIPILLWLCLAEDRPTGGRIWAAAAALLFWIAPIWSLPYGGSGQELHEHGWQLILGSSYFFAMLLFLSGVAAMLLVRSLRPSLEAPRARLSAVPVAVGGATGVSLHDPPRL